MTHDYKRHGTTTLFAALDVLEGKVIGRCMQRHRHQEFIRFLNGIEATVPVGNERHPRQLRHAQTPEGQDVAGAPPALRLPLHADLLLLAQRRRGLLRQAHKRRLQRGVFRSIIELQAAINRFIEEANHDPKPFVWTADPDKIIAAVKRGHQVLNLDPLVHATNIDRLLDAKQRPERRLIISGHVDLLDVDLKPFRRLHNHLEHLDERLDQWVREYDGHPFFDMNIVTGTRGFPRKAFLRALDGNMFKFYGEDYDMIELHAAILEIEQRLSGACD